MLKLVGSYYPYMKVRSFPFKMVAVSVAGAVVVAGSVHAFGKAINREGLQILNVFIDQFDDQKEDSVGCCLPQCGESEKTVCEHLAGRKWVKGSCENVEECKVGCCQFDCKTKQMAHDSCDAVNGEWNLGECDVGCCRIDVGVIETLPYKICSECTGGSWKEGQIFTSYLEADDSSEIGGNQTNWEMKISLKACGESPVTANWTGAWEWLWVVEFPDGTHEANHTGDTSSFTPDSGGRGSFNIRGMPAQVKVSKSKMHIVYPMGGLGDIILDGPVVKR